MLDIKFRFTCGDSDLSEIIKKRQDIMDCKKYEKQISDNAGKNSVQS